MYTLNGCRLLVHLIKLKLHLHKIENINGETGGQSLDNVTELARLSVNKLGGQRGLSEGTRRRSKLERKYLGRR